MLQFVMVFTIQNMTLRSKSSKMYSETSSVFDDTAFIYHALSFFLHFTCIVVYVFIMTYLFRIKSEKKYKIHFKQLAKKRYLIPRTNLYIKKIRVPTNVAYNCMNQNIIPRHSETSVLIQLSLLSNDINSCDCLFL